MLMLQLVQLIVYQELLRSEKVQNVMKKITFIDFL